MLQQTLWVLGLGVPTPGSGSSLRKSASFPGKYLCMAFLLLGERLGANLVQRELFVGFLSLFLSPFPALEVDILF